MRLRQSYEHKGKLALMTQQRYAHGNPRVNRATCSLKTMGTYLGRFIRGTRPRLRLAGG
ncbi:MAG: hypothetical protein L0Y50_06685 [Beijerinckiaceae bacterium]|nr:hypothetical protein [Beijerinckiaceae bacterium]